MRTIGLALSISRLSSKPSQCRQTVVSPQMQIGQISLFRPCRRRLFALARHWNLTCLHSVRRSLTGMPMVNPPEMQLSFNLTQTSAPTRHSEQASRRQACFAGRQQQINWGRPRSRSSRSTAAGLGASDADTFRVIVSPANHSPVVDLNGASDGIGFGAVFTEGAGRQASLRPKN